MSNFSNNFCLQKKQGFLYKVYKFLILIKNSRIQKKSLTHNKKYHKNENIIMDHYFVSISHSPLFFFYDIVKRINREICYFGFYHLRMSNFSNNLCLKKKQGFSIYSL